MPNRVSEKTYYSAQHVTGPGCVLVTLRFGKTPKDGSIVFKKALVDGDGEVKHDVERFVKEVEEGIDQANKEMNDSVEVEEIQIVTDDYPMVGQVARVSYWITKHYIEKGANQAELTTPDAARPSS
ncbi:hypothetical protein [Pelagicoccus mobilis]|uniref:Uncharacterized protein n=1 Tax=Pelagicoccus mobilis TaxID=415221 RepID=A0A934VPA7_9BACT|nr:hypothetical protein [Pelagicoccus mobilis]MBK1877087.1 hypothetical protein [Pelagicoccus mobilis]